MQIVNPETLVLSFGKRLRAPAWRGIRDRTYRYERSVSLRECVVLRLWNCAPDLDL